MVNPKEFALEDAAQNVDGILLLRIVAVVAHVDDVAVCLFFSLRHGDVFRILRGHRHNQQRQQQGLARRHHCLAILS